MEEKLLLELIEAVNNVAEPTSVDVFTLMFAMFVFIMTFNDNFDLARTQNRIALYQERLNLFRRVEKYLCILNQVAQETKQPVWNKTTIPEFDAKELKYLFSNSVKKKFHEVEKMYFTIIDTNHCCVQNTNRSKIEKNIEINLDFLMKKFDYYLDIFSFPNKIVFINVFYKFIRWLVDTISYLYKKLLILFAKKNMP